MSNNAFYLCLDTDAGEYELLSSHETRNEAYAALQELDAASVDACRCSVQSIDTLEAHIESMIEEQFDVDMRIDRKKTLCDATRQARAMIRQIRDTLQGEAYLPLTDKFIELTDTLDNVLVQPKMENRPLRVRHGK